MNPRFGSVVVNRKFDLYWESNFFDVVILWTDKIKLRVSATFRIKTSDLFPIRINLEL
jgi:hypothetical protein